jgi:hypothetical protein
MLSSGKQVHDLLQQYENLHFATQSINFIYVAGHSSGWDSEEYSEARRAVFSTSNETKEEHTLMGPILLGSLNLRI